MTEFALRPFAVAEAEQVAHWAATPQDLNRAAGSEEWPLTAKQVTRWALEANFAWTLRADGDLAAYAEIVEDDVEGDAEIQHLLVAPDLRGQGIGRDTADPPVRVSGERAPLPRSVGARGAGQSRSGRMRAGRGV